MSQRFGLYGDLTVLENLLFYADLFNVPKKELPKRMDRLLGFSNLTPFKDRLAQNLSGGMKQKLGLACALIHTPEILFLDEPTFGVDPISRGEFWQILYELLKEGVTIFVSTAYMDEAERCHRVGLLHRGKLIACDEPDRLKLTTREAFFEIRSKDRKRTKQILEGLPVVKGTGLFGDSIHLRLETKEKMNEVLKESPEGRSCRDRSAGDLPIPGRHLHLHDPISRKPVMTANPIVVEVESLEKRFGSFVAVDHISFQVKAGQIFGFLGPNGSGKSTTIRMLCGILMPNFREGHGLGI